MKRFLTFALIILISVSIGWSEKKDKSGSEIKTFFKKIDALVNQGKYEDALKMTNDGLERYLDNRYDFTRCKFRILRKMGKHKEAVVFAVESDKLAPRVSANRALDIADLYLKLKDIKNALKWVTISVDRGFQNYYVFYKYDDYKPIRGDRLNALIERMKAGIGLGKPAKQFTRKDLSGNEVSPAKYKGKVFLIDFWATWCPPCVREMPGLKKYYAEFKDKGFEIIGISVDSDRKKLDEFLKENKLEWPIVFGGKGWYDETKELYGVKNVPSTWLVDKKGVLRYFALKGDKLRDAIAELIKERP